MPKKIERGDPLASAGFVGYVKKVKNERGDPLETKKIFEKKVAQCRKKIRRGDPLDTSGFVCFLEEVKNERWDPMDLLPFALAGPGLRWFQDCF